MIVLDLEWNRGYDKNPLNEILQIGAVRLDRLGGPITDTFNAFIRPTVHKKFDPGAKELPELSQSKASSLDFPTAYAAFQDWCGDETLFASWGGGDTEVLRQNCGYWKIPCAFPDHVRNFQAAFSALLGTSQQLALNRAVDYCNIPAPFEFHNALHDALYTAILGRYLTEDLLERESLSRRTRQFTQTVYPEQPRRRVGPFPSPEALLNNRTTRRMACPLCGQTAWVLHWYPAQTRQYVSDFRCPEHGLFPCRLTLASQDSGQWRGQLAVPPVTPALLYALDAAFRHKAHNCHGSKPHKRRRGRHRRSTVK